MAAISCSRPIKLVSDCGKLVGRTTRIAPLDYPDYTRDSPRRLPGRQGRLAVSRRAGYNWRYQAPSPPRMHTAGQAPPGDTMTTIEQITLTHIAMPLVTPFETSFGRDVVRETITVEMRAADGAGWGQVVAFEEPSYSYETLDTCWTILTRY